MIQEALDTSGSSLDFGKLNPGQLNNIDKILADPINVDVVPETSVFVIKSIEQAVIIYS